MRVNKLTKYRVLIGLSQRALAQACDLSPTTICFTETGKTIPSRTTRLKIANVLGYAEAEIFPNGMVLLSKKELVDGFKRKFKDVELTFPAIVEFLNAFYQ